MADASAYDSAVDTLFPQSDTPEPSAPPTPEAAPAGGDTPAVDKYDAAVSSLLEGQKNAQKAAIVQNSQSGVVPSRQALAVELAKTYGMPVEVAYENADTLKERPHVDVEKILKNSPYLAQTLADPAKGPAAMPDADVLSEIEQRFRDAGPNADFSSTFKKGLASYMWKHLFEGPAQGKANDLSPEDSAAATQARVDAAAKKPAEDAQAITQANLDRQWRLANDPVYAASQQAYLPESGKVVDLYNPNSDLTKTAARANIAKDVEALTYAKDNPVTKTAFGDAIDTVFNGLGMTAANAMKWGGEVSDLIPSSIKPRLALAAPMLAPIFVMGGEKDIHGKGALTRAADATAKTLDTMFPGDKGRANDLSHQVLAGGVSTLPYMLGGGIGEAVGLPAAAVAAILGAVTEGGSQAFDAEQHNATYWQKMLALGVGTIAGLSEAIPVENAFHYLEEIPFRSWAVKTAVKGTTGGMAEGVQEMGQTGVEDLTAKLTYDKSRAVIGNMLQAGGPAFLIGMVFGGLGHAAQAHAEQARDNLIKIGDLIQKAKLSQISPGMMSDFVKNVGHDVQVKPEALETLFQENGGEQQRAVYEQFRARIDEAKNNNAEVTISASEIPALRGMTSELGWSKFSDDVRFPSKNPTDRTFTVNEAIGFRKTMDSVVEHLGKEGDNAIPPSPVYTSVREQLVKAGQSPQAAHFMGLIWENAFRTAAARSKDGKLDPVDFFNSMGVKISNSALTAQEMAPQLDALRAEASSSAGPKMEVSQTTKQGITSTVRSYEIANPLGGDAPETVKVITRSNGDAIIQRAGKDDPLIDISNMLKAGFSPEKAVAISLGDHPDGMEPDVSKVRQVPVEGQAVAAKSDPGLNSLRSQLAAAGIKTADLAGMSNEQVAQALAERTLAQSDGTTLNQGGQTETPEFKTWFGDSKVVDEKGAPLVVYHGTNRAPNGIAVFDTRQTDETGTHFGTADQANMFAEGGGAVYPVYLKIRNPLRLRDLGGFLVDTVGPQLDELGIPEPKEPNLLGGDYLRARIKEAGYDGVVYLNRREGGHNPFGPDGVSGDELDAMTDDEVRETFPEASDSYIAFDPTQIKSATGNSGTFDPNNPNILYQSEQDANPDEEGADVTEIPGEPVPEEAVTVGSLEAANNLSKSRVWDTGRQLKMALQRAILNAVNGANLLARTAENRAYLVKVGVKDALAALAQNANAIGWYDLKTRQALAVMSLVHPELATDETSRFAFTWALATTSNGIKVDKNFELAEMVYSRWKASNKDPAKRVMPTDVKAGKAQKPINKSLQLFNDLSQAWGLTPLRLFMLSNFKAGDIKAMTGIMPTGEWAKTDVRGASVIGPKIGNGFFSNLYGKFDALTMDRWLVRTWGRWTGTLIEIDRANVDLSRTRLREALKGLDREGLIAALRAVTKEKTNKKTGVTTVSEVKPKDRERLIEVLRTLQFGRGKGVLETLSDSAIDDLSDAILRASQEPKFREAMNGVKGGEELRKAGNSLAKYLDGQKEQPEGPGERVYIREVFAEMLSELQQDPRYKDLTMSDLQAVLWYAEKRLYETAKEDLVAADIAKLEGDEVAGYDDDEAPDYANAAAAVARTKGVSDRRINAALKKEEDRGRSDTAQSGSGSTGPGADGQTGQGQQGQARGFTESERREFVQRRALDRVRANRSGDAQSSWSYAREGGGDGTSPRVLAKVGKSLGATVSAIWSPGKGLSQVFGRAGIKTPDIYELEQGSAENAARFVSAISEARKTLGAVGEAVHVYPVEDYQALRLFLTEGGKAGFALKPDGDIVSVFSAKGTGAGRAVMETAIAAGGKKLDCFHTILPEFYSAHGFRGTSRLLWNDEIAKENMPNWDKGAMADFNGGEPDVVFMVYDPEYKGTYDRESTPLFNKDPEKDYGRALNAQTKAVKEVSSRQTTTLNQTAQSQQTFARGSISFGPGRDAFHITLTGQANLSTFLHESGHFFLEMLQKLVESGNASEQQAADLEKWRSWMGLKPGEKIEVRHHEMAARAFEAYFMEGKAPSAELQGAFQRFKGWLTMIYRQLRGLNVNLTDEVRGVMDRLLATDDAISQARADIGWRGAPMSQEATGFTDAEYKTYVDNWNKASDAQSQDADARVMLEAAREIQRAWRDEKIATTKALEEKLAQSRGWIAWKLLTKGERIDEFAPGRTSLKIDPDTIPAEWRGDAVGMTTDASSGGMPLDVVGEMLGFKSGEEMLSLIAGTRAAERAIPGQVRAEMEAKHGKMDDVQIALEAARAVHNKPTMDVLLTEYRAMGEKVGSKTPSNLNALLAAQAEEKVSGLTRRQLDPAKWRRAELKSAREAGAKAAKGDAMGAFIAKRQQLIASHMAKASLDAIDRIDKIKDYLSRFQTNRLRSQLGKAGDMYLDGVDQILEGIQFKDVSLKAIKARKSLDDLVREAEKNGEAVFVSDETKALLGRKNYTELTLQELESVHDAVKNLWTIAKAVTAVRKGNEKIALEAALTDITKETEALLPARKQRDHLNKTMIDEKMEGLSAFHAGLLKIEFVLDWLGKTAHSLVYQPITDAHFAAWKLHQEVTAPFMAKLQNMPKEQRARWNTKFKFLDYPLELKGGNVWAIALNLGNEGNKAKLLAGYGWTEAQVKDELNKILTKEDWDLVQEAWDTIDKLWPQMAAVVKGATGLEPPKIVASPVETPHGTYRGGYYPVVYDTAIDSRMEEKLDSAISPEEMFSKRFTSFAIGNGFTKGRTNNTGKLLFSPDVIPQHLGEVIHYITHYEAVKQADRVMRSPVFKALVRKHLGDAVYAEMKKWLKNVATNKTDSQERRADAGDKMFRWVRGSAQLASLGLNIKSALKQPLGIAATLDAIKFKHWAIGIKEAWLSPNVRQNWREAFAKSKELGPLLKEYDRDMAAISRAYSEKIGNRALEGAYNLAFTPISVMQSVANVAAWRGAYSQATQEGMSESDAINFADKVVRQTQGGAAMKDLSGMQRGGEGAKFFTMFYSYYGVLYNRMSDVQIRERGAKNLHRKAGRYAVLLLLGEALNLAFDRYLWDQMDPPDKADDSPFYTRLALNTVESAVNTLPIARDVYAIGAAIAQHQRARPPAAFGAILRAEQGAEAIISHFREGKPITRAKARNIAAFAGVMTNTPAVGVWRAIDLLFGEEIFGK